MNVYCDHHLADEHTNRIPFVMRWPGLSASGTSQAGRVDRAFHYQVDLAATVLDLLDVKIPDDWDGESFAPSLRQGVEAGRDHLVLSQGAWTCQRSVRFDDYLFLHTFHDGFHELPETLLFDLADDPHEQRDLAALHPQVVAEARRRLADWHADAMRDHPNGTDPMQTVLAEGGPWHVRGHLPAYLERLRATDRSEAAARLAAAHGS
jgi:arylsulfatase A-like enzyme